MRLVREFALDLALFDVQSLEPYRQMHCSDFPIEDPLKSTRKKIFISEYVQPFVYFGGILVHVSLIGTIWRLFFYTFSLQNV